MRSIKKTKNKRGMTLVEVLMVVALMSVMLGLAMPNLLAESQDIKMATMDGYARSVAVAVQSRLYGMKNAGTATHSEYAMLREASQDETVTVDGEEKSVEYVCNFGETAKGGDMLLSDAITDVELLKNGKIAVVYDPDTADVLQTYYSESTFDIKTMFPTVAESFLKENVIGSYIGLGAPKPEMQVGVPDFTITWQYDDELYLELQMKGTPDPSIVGKNLGLELFATIPDPTGKTKQAEILIYAEGMFATDYNDGKIKQDVGTLTIDKIQKNGGYLRIAFDSMITRTAYYGNYASNLRHQTDPKTVTMANSVLYPRDKLIDWFNIGTDANPYLEFGKNEGLTSEEVYEAVSKATSITDIIDMEDTVSLRVELHVISNDTREANGTTAMLHEFDDENFGSRNLRSEYISPYFHALSQNRNEVVLSSMRDLNNLSYLFETANSINKATLQSDINSQQLQDKLIAVRHALLAVHPEFSGAWNSDINATSCRIASSICKNKENFTLSGKKPEGGSYAINCMQLGQDPSQGGLFAYAENCTFEDLDIINPLIWKNINRRNFLLQDGTTKTMRVSGLDMMWSSTATGALVGVAVNCQFKNVRTYIDAERSLMVESSSGEKTRLGIGLYKISGVVAGGLVGIAIGSDDKPTTFDGCAASLMVGQEPYSSTGECVYAGGLVGLAMGEVEISNIYASSQLSGYYAGGLVGGMGTGKWNSPYATAGEAKGELTIQDSFAAGCMMFNIRVGGGLIGHINEVDNPKVTGCYSAVQWKIIPTVAYGTFAGDTSNYYLYPRKFDLPVTANILARFDYCTGNVFSLQGEKNGIACTESTLAKALGTTKWVNADSTHRWSWIDGNLFPLESADYPFLMPEGNADFYGEWNRWYDNGDEVPKTMQMNFENFYVAYYANTDLSYGRYIESGIVISQARWIGLTDGKIALYKLGAQHYDLNADGTFFADGAKDTYWANMILGGALFGQGIEGATQITATEDNKIDFFSAAYYDPDYNVGKGSDFLPKNITGNFDYGDIPLMWDYAGYYFVDYGHGEIMTKRYYISFDDDVAEGSAIFDGTKFIVNKDEFESKLKFTHIELSATNVHIKWDDQNGFCVADGGAE